MRTLSSSISLSLVSLLAASCGAMAPMKVATTPAPSRVASADGAVGRPMSSSSRSSDVSVVSPTPAPTDRPGLGTVWGENVYAPITMKPFERASPQAWATAVIRYNDADGVAAQARYYGGSIAPLEIYPGDGSIGVSLVSEGGGLLPGFSSGAETLVVGQDGDRYRIVVRNATDARFEIVASVDGLDVLDGQPASPDRRGYILEPRGELVIDGFRQTDEQVAAFRFGNVASSYAAQTSGDGNVGVIGVAIFPERGAVWTPGELSRRAGADPFPARTYATPP